MALSPGEKVRRFDAALAYFRRRKRRLKELTQYIEGDDAEDRRSKAAAAGDVVIKINGIRECLGITAEEESEIDKELGLTTQDED